MSTSGSDKHPDKHVDAHRPRSARRLLVTVTVLLAVGVGVVFGVRSQWFSARQHAIFAQCSVGSYSFDTGQAAIASSMVGVVISRGLPARAATALLAAGLQESKLRNIPAGAGDRDSVGVLQQRPSQGWGTPEQLSDVRFAAGAFLDALVKVPGWQELPLQVAIQDVQISADGSLYARHAGRAQALADALLGTQAAALNCQFAKPSVVAGTDVVAAQLSRDLPVNPPVTTAGTVRVTGAGWATVAWFVANADRLGIDSVDYDRRTWTRTRGWHDSAAGTDVVVATMFSPS